MLIVMFFFGKHFECDVMRCTIRWYGIRCASSVFGSVLSFWERFSASPYTLAISDSVARNDFEVGVQQAIAAVHELSPDMAEQLMQVILSRPKSQQRMNAVDAPVPDDNELDWINVHEPITPNAMPTGPPMVLGTTHVNALGAQTLNRGRGKGRGRNGNTVLMPKAMAIHTPPIIVNNGNPGTALGAQEGWPYGWTIGGNLVACAVKGELVTGPDFQELLGVIMDFIGGSIQQMSPMKAGTGRDYFTAELQNSLYGYCTIGLTRRSTTSSSLSYIGLKTHKQQ